MEEENLDGKEFIIAFFDEFEKKISNLDHIVKQGFLEEALVLACCYISTPGNFRYGMISDEKRNFIKIIYEYSNFKELFSKISWINFYKKGKDCSEKGRIGKPIARYGEIRDALFKIFNKKSNHHGRWTKTE